MKVIFFFILLLTVLNCNPTNQTKDKQQHFSVPSVFESKEDLAAFFKPLDSEISNLSEGAKEVFCVASYPYSGRDTIDLYDTQLKLFWIVLPFCVTLLIEVFAFQSRDHTLPLLIQIFAKNELCLNANSERHDDLCRLISRLHQDGGGEDFIYGTGTNTIFLHVNQLGVTNFTIIPMTRLAI